jgi:hypothetical protein
MHEESEACLSGRSEEEEEAKSIWRHLQLPDFEQPQRIILFFQQLVLELVTDSCRYP